MDKEKAQFRSSEENGRVKKLWRKERADSEDNHDRSQNRSGSRYFFGCSEDDKMFVSR
jgi:hypothetical protein